MASYVMSYSKYQWGNLISVLLMSFDVLDVFTTTEKIVILASHALFFDDEMQYFTLCFGVFLQKGTYYVWVNYI